MLLCSSHHNSFGRYASDKLLSDFSDDLRWLYAVLVDSLVGCKLGQLGWRLFQALCVLSDNRTARDLGVLPTGAECKECRANLKSGCSPTWQWNALGELLCSLCWMLALTKNKEVLKDVRGYFSANTLVSFHLWSGVMPDCSNRASLWSPHGCCCTTCSGSAYLGLWCCAQSV